MAKRGTDDPMDASKRQATGFWGEHPELARFDGPYLHEATKILIGQVFDMIDSDCDHEITPEDFQKVTHHEAEAMHKWEQIRLEFASEQTISPHDFVVGIKRMAWKKPVDPAKFTATAVSNYSCFMISLNDAINASIKRSLRELLASMVVYSGETVNMLHAAWMAVDYDQDGTITEADFRRPGADERALAYFRQLAAMLDENSDGSISQAEFERGLKFHAINTLDSAVFGSFSTPTAAVSTGGKTRLARFIQATNEGIVRACSEIIEACKSS